MEGEGTEKRQIRAGMQPLGSRPVLLGPAAAVGEAESAARLLALSPRMGATE